MGMERVVFSPKVRVNSVLVSFTVHTLCKDSLCPPRWVWLRLWIRTQILGLYSLGPHLGWTTYWKYDLGQAISISLCLCFLICKIGITRQLWKVNEAEFLKGLAQYLIHASTVRKSDKPLSTHRWDEKKEWLFQAKFDLGIFRKEVEFKQRIKGNCGFRWTLENVEIILSGRREKWKVLSE